jgi:hypothetical protein
VRAGHYNLESRFKEVHEFKQLVTAFFSKYLCDSFLLAEVHVSIMT